MGNHYDPRDYDIETDHDRERRAKGQAEQERMRQKAQEEKAAAEREAKIQRMAEMIYATEFVRANSINSSQDAAYFAKAQADSWARLARSGVFKLPEFKP